MLPTAPTIFLAGYQHVASEITPRNFKSFTKHWALASFFYLAKIFFSMKIICLDFCKIMLLWCTFIVTGCRVCNWQLFGFQLLYTQCTGAPPKLNIKKIILTSYWGSFKILLNPYEKQKLIPSLVKLSAMFVLLVCLDMKFWLLKYFYDPAACCLSPEKN